MITSLGVQLSSHKVNLGLSIISISKQTLLSTTLIPNATLSQA